MGNNFYPDAAKLNLDRWLDSNQNDGLYRFQTQIDALNTRLERKSSDERSKSDDGVQLDYPQAAARYSWSMAITIFGSLKSHGFKHDDLLFPALVPFFGTPGFGSLVPRFDKQDRQHLDFLDKPLITATIEHKSHDISKLARGGILELLW
ncbi:hypothetical protein L1987_34252 [Smallanthus sonchifolius]|uniref:Uncharacterized protein n=1 Tax=Smallanthus sonchifolius TaxID=185202 RepID=A0ACB9HV06_9ASTR|nr:hypothetical protein L1987_34252 [Smallanthus sonchifolius]